MRETETKLTIRTSLPTRAMRLSAVALGVGLLMVCGAARAQDDDEGDDKTFEEKIIEGIMHGIGGINMDNAGIDYRERSPLVVPPKIDLPPPASSAEAAAPPNWPKDPDEARRKAAAAQRKKDKKDTRDAGEMSRDAGRILTPSELNQGRTAVPSRASDDPVTPGVTNNNPILSPSQLGYNGGFMGLFKGNGSESKEFKSEPPRESLVQPPPGYQTPSSNYAYGTGPKESLNKQYNPITDKEQ